MENKSFKFELKEIDDSGQFEGYASVFDVVDHGNDIVEKGAFKKTLQEKKEFPLLYYHDPREVLGVIEAEEDQKGLRVLAKLNLNVQRAREAYELLKQKAIKGLSIGYDVIKEAWDKDVRRLKEVKLWEISLVTFPMNEMASVTGVKALEDSLSKVIQFADDEQKAGRKISSSNMKLIKQAIEALNALLEAAEPSDNDTQGDKKSQDNPDKPVNADHLLDSTIEELKKLKNFRKEE